MKKVVQTPQMNDEFYAEFEQFKAQTSAWQLETKLVIDALRHVVSEQREEIIKLRNALTEDKQNNFSRQQSVRKLLKGE